jgi:hypothetical protein
MGSSANVGGPIRHFENHKVGPETATSSLGSAGEQGEDER